VFDPGAWTIGLWYYGTKIQTQTAGLDVHGMTMLLRRVNDDGVGGNRPLSWHCHNETSDPGTTGADWGPPFVTEASMGVGPFVNGQTVEFWLDGSFVNALRAGLHRGLAMYGGEFMIMDSVFENGYSGLLQAHHLG
jgi:hypothetical protein